MEGGKEVDLHQPSAGKPNIPHLKGLLGPIDKTVASWVIKVTALILRNGLIFCMYFFQEPLNSEDDVSDEEGQELFDTENVVVCQYDKVISTVQNLRFLLSPFFLSSHNFYLYRSTCT